MNINEAIRSATLETWDEPIENHEHWRSHNLLNSDGTEKFRHTLYVHVIKNDSLLNIYDNNGKIGGPGGRNGNKNPRIICYSKSYMIKFGKTDHNRNDDTKGILSRRQLDFKGHYHTRENINHIYKVSLNPSSDNNYSDNRIGSNTSLLHLIAVLNDKNSSEIRNLESQLIILLKQKYLENPCYINSIFIREERINIPLSSIENEDNFLNEITELFEEFRASIQ